MTTQVERDPMLAQLLAEVDSIDAEVSALQSTLGEAELGRTAPHGGWTVGQVFDHLIVSNSLYYGAIEKALERARPSSHSKWRPSLLGRLLANSLSPRSSRRVPAPRVFKPGAKPSANVVKLFLESQERFRALARRATAVDLSRTRVSSPVSPLIRINLGDAFRMIVVHEQRHLGQIRRILAETTNAV